MSMSPNRSESENQPADVALTTRACGDLLNMPEWAPFVLVLAAKVFAVAEERNLPLVASKLKDFKLEQEVRIEGDSFSLLSEITDLDISKESLEGTFAFDAVFQVNQHGKQVPFVRTFEAPFMFDLFGKNLFLSIFDKKARANSIANEMSKTLFMSLGQVVEARIQPEVLKRFEEENGEAKIVF